MKKMTTPKVIADPIYGITDVRPVLPMIETREFQSLGDKRQLGMAYLVFPSATHTRKAHSLGSYHATRQLADRWIKRGFISAREGDALAGYALYHDIGHPALSHVTEALCDRPNIPGAEHMSVNSALSLAIANDLKSQIKDAGIDFKLFLKIASHANPLAAAVSDKNLGMEKLDYLERDGLYTILSRPVGVEYLRHHIYFIDGELAIDEKVVDNAIEVQNYYLKIYKNVYLRKTGAIAQRMVQKMVHHLILAGEISRSELPGLTDSELFGLLRFSKDDFVKATYDLLKCRDLFREAIVIRPQHFATPETRTAKPITIFGASPSEIAKLAKNPLLQARNQAGLASVEDAIARIAGIPAGSVLIVPIQDQERFEAKDIMIYQGAGRKLASLKERYPAHFNNVEEVAQTYIAFRICTPERYRKALSAPKTAKKIFEYAMGA